MIKVQIGAPPCFSYLLKVTLSDESGPMFLKSFRGGGSIHELGVGIFVDNGRIPCFQH